MQKQNTDRWIKCIANKGNVIATAISATHLVKDAQKKHTSSVRSALEIKSLGEALMAGLLLASTCKQGERVSLSVKGEQLLRQAVVDANPDGTVRGFILTREAAKQTDETLGPWQSGTVSVVRLKLNDKEPYVGTVPAVTGHLAKDITFYLSQSEQIPSAVGLSVSVQGNEIESAGAFLVQVLPGATLEEIKAIENNIQNMESLAAQMTKNSDPTLLLSQIFNDTTFTLIDEKPVRFECNCSKNRVERALKLLGAEELSAMIREDKGAKITCDFCGNHFDFSDADLEQMVASFSEK